MGPPRNWGKHEIQGDLQFGQNRVRYRNLRSVRPSSFQKFLPDNLV